MPRLCFYRLDDSEGSVANEQTFKIERAELLLDYDDSGISFLTNAALL